MSLPSGTVMRHHKKKNLAVYLATDTEHLLFGLAGNTLRRTAPCAVTAGGMFSTSPSGDSVPAVGGGESFMAAGPDGVYVCSDAPSDVFCIIDQLDQASSSPSFWEHVDDVTAALSGIATQHPRGAALAKELNTALQCTSQCSGDNCRRCNAWKALDTRRNTVYRHRNRSGEANNGDTLGFVMLPALRRCAAARKRCSTNTALAKASRAKAAGRAVLALPQSDRAALALLSRAAVNLLIKRPYWDVICPPEPPRHGEGGDESPGEEDVLVIAE